MPRRFIWVLVLLGAVALTVILVPGLRWRTRLIALKSVGKIPDLGWLEMSRMLIPRSGFYLEPLTRSRNPHTVIFVPDTSRAALAAGQETYLAVCSSCHGADGQGATGPGLVGRSLVHGNSDWALYQVVSRGIPGTRMTSAALPREERWRVVAYLNALRAARHQGRDTSFESIGAEPMRPISADVLIGSRRDSANWLMYSGSYDGWRYSPLNGIDRANVGDLRLLWIHQTAESERKFETTPLVVDGRMFLTTSRGVAALDAETGEVLWTYSREPGGEERLCCGKVNRGLAILDGTLYWATADAQVMALDARDGLLRWATTAAVARDGYSFTSAPLAVRNLVVVGSAGGEFPTRGFIAAYDAKTGTERWRFHTIPAPGEPGSESWSGDSWKTGGAPAWLTGAYDPARDLIYWGVGNPNPDYNGDDRRGDNLYSNSVVALEARTGRLRWHFQFTPHDEYDWDAAQIPVLLDTPPPDSQALLLWANRNAFYYILDRQTGRFLQATPFAWQSWALGIDSAGRPIRRPGSEPSRAGTLGNVGATNWWSPTYSPRSGLFYVPTLSRADVYFKGRGAESGGERMGGWHQIGSGARLSVRALEAVTGKLRWEYELLREERPVWPDIGGLLSTGGDLVFAGGRSVLVALDATTGQRLWSFRTGGSINAAPISYLVGGRQRITIAAGRSILTFGID